VYFELILYEKVKNNYFPRINYYHYVVIIVTIILLLQEKRNIYVQMFIIKILTV